MNDHKSGNPARSRQRPQSQGVSAHKDPAQPIAGYVDFYGPSPLGWTLGGWITASWDRASDTPDVELCIDNETTSNGALLAFYERPDVGTAGHGFIMALPDLAAAGDTLAWITLSAPHGSFKLLPASGAKYLSGDDILQQARASLEGSPVSGSQRLLSRILPQGSPAREALLHNPTSSVFLVVEETYWAPPTGAVLRGWFFDPDNEVRAIHILGNGTQRTLRPEDWVRLPRPDVVTNISSSYGYQAGNFGFLAYAPDVLSTDGSTQIVITTKDGRHTHKNVPQPRKQGLAAIESILSGLDLRRQELRAGFDSVIGPAVAAINAQRLTVRPQVRQIRFGASPSSPRCSIVIPLYGRVDFMEYQLAFASPTWGTTDEIIYVLDDPERTHETETLARSCHEKFRIPFTLLCLDRNMGFAPANNVGLSYARGDYVCLLNSDVFPKEPRWLDYMIDTLEHDNCIGAVGALLLFEDDSIQHQGGEFISLPEFADWHFPIHTNKGRKLFHNPNLMTVDMITAACLTMKRNLLMDLGCLDESYVIGDFEDAELSHRIRSQGLRCVVDPRAILYHLERQSQNAITNSWRMNLTLFNAWLHNRRWFSTPHAE